MMNKWPVLFVIVLFVAATAYAQTEQAEQTLSQPSETVSSLKEEINAIKLQAANNKRLLANENEELLNKIGALKKAVAVLEKANVELENANKELIENPGELSLRVAASEESTQEWRAKATSFEKQCAALTREKEFLLGRIATLSAENKRAWTNRNDLYRKIEHLRSTIAMAKKKQKNLLKAKILAENEAKSLAAKNKNLQTDLLSVNKEYSSARNENRRLKGELVPVRKLKAKLAISYQQLGTAYAQMKQYNLAIDAYNKSLKYDFKNPVVHCNLGLLYEHSHTRSQRAIYHLNKYLELNPDAADRNEITFIIKRLSEVEDGDIVFYN